MVVTWQRVPNQCPSLRARPRFCNASPPPGPPPPPLFLAKLPGPARSLEIARTFARSASRCFGRAAASCHEEGLSTLGRKIFAVESNRGATHITWTNTKELFRRCYRDQQLRLGGHHTDGVKVFRCGPPLPQEDQPRLAPAAWQRAAEKRNFASREHVRRAGRTHSDGRLAHPGRRAVLVLRARYRLRAERVPRAPGRQNMVEGWQSTRPG